MTFSIECPGRQQVGLRLVGEERWNSSCVAVTIGTML